MPSGVVVCSLPHNDSKMVNSGESPDRSLRASLTKLVVASLRGHRRGSYPCPRRMHIPPPRNNRARRSGRKNRRPLKDYDSPDIILGPHRPASEAKFVAVSRSILWQTSGSSMR